MPEARFGSSRTRIAVPLALALLICGCQSKPKPPPGMTPSVEVAPPAKSEGWKQVATTADEDRITRLGLAWQEALAEAEPGCRRGDPQGRACCSGRARACRGPQPTPGSYNCRLIKLGKATAKARAYRELQALLLLRRGRGGPADHRQADRQPAPRRAAVGGRRFQPPDLPRQPGARRRGHAAAPMATIPSATWPECSSGSGRSAGGW